MSQETFDRFMEAYARELTIAVEDHPEEYAYGADRVPEVLARMRPALERGTYNHDGRAMTPFTETVYAEAARPYFHVTKPHSWIWVALTPTRRIHRFHHVQSERADAHAAEELPRLKRGYEWRGPFEY